MAKRLGKRMGIIGGGNMAESFIHGLLDAGLCLSSEIIVSDIRKERREYIEETFAVNVASTNTDCVEGSDLVIIAVKPQNMADLLRELSDAACEGKLFISIVAGVTLDRIEKALGGKEAVIRVMPNTPALIGEGISVWARGRYAGDRDAEVTRLILGALGKDLEVDEGLMNAATALSGSGPAYVYYLLEAMQAAGVTLGFTPGHSREMAIQTVIGAARLAETSGCAPKELRERVTSPGGTTAAAIRVLDSAGVKESVVKAIRAACRRAKELSRE